MDASQDREHDKPDEDPARAPFFLSRPDAERIRLAQRFVVRFVVRFLRLLLFLRHCVAFLLIGGVEQRQHLSEGRCMLLKNSVDFVDLRTETDAIEDDVKVGGKTGGRARNGP